MLGQPPYATQAVAGCCGGSSDVIPFATVTPAEGVKRTLAELETWFPGQEDGDIVARLLFGLATLSGKLPVTFPRAESDLPVTSPRQWPGVLPLRETLTVRSPSSGQ